MLERPDAATLLGVMADALTRDVLPATEGGAQHAARVVANLCRILERELRDAGARERLARAALVELLDREGALDELVRALDARLAEQPDDLEFAARARRALLEDACRRLAIDKPGYDT